MNSDTPAKIDAPDRLQSMLIGGFALFGAFFLAWTSVIRGFYAEYVIPPALLFATIYFLRSKMLIREYWNATPRAFGAAMLGFMIMAAIAAWRTTPLSSPFLELKPYMFFVVFYLALFSFTFFCILNDRQQIKGILRALFWGWLVGLSILTAEFTFQPLSNFMNSLGAADKIYASDFNRSVYILAVLSWLIVPTLRPRLGPVGAIAPVGVIWLLSLGSENQAVQIGLPIALAAYLAALWKPKPISTVMLAGAALLLVTAPFTYQVLFRVAPDVPGLNEVIFLVRAEIWDGVARLILKNPFLGEGFYTTMRAGNTLVEHIYFLPKAAAHPHNVFLEIWADLGFVGVIFGLLLIYAVWRGLRALSPGVLPAAIGATTMILLVLLLSYSMWSAWYIGFLAFFAGFLRLVDQSLRDV